MAVAPAAPNWPACARGESSARVGVTPGGQHLAGRYGILDVMIGCLYEVVIDCPDPRSLARFYEQLLGGRRHHDEPEWVTVRAGEGSIGLAFQRVSGYRPPRWPDPGHPQHLHLDVMVDNLDIAEAEVLKLGATLLDGSDKPIGYRVYADPAGHPFCLLTPESVPPLA